MLLASKIIFFKLMIFLLSGLFSCVKVNKNENRSNYRATSMTDLPREWEERSKDVKEMIDYEDALHLKVWIQTIY